MEEILENLREEINKFTAAKEKVKEMESRMEKMNSSIEELKSEMQAMPDRQNSFYQDAKNELEKKEKLRAEAFNQREDEKEKVEKAISELKEKILEEIEAKKEFIEKNRGINEKYDIKELETEKKNLEEQIKLNDTSKEQFLTMDDQGKKAVKNAKEQYLNNKRKLKEVEEKLEIAQYSEEGKVDYDIMRKKYMEMSTLETKIKQELTYENLENLAKEIKKEEPQQTSTTPEENTQEPEEIKPTKVEKTPEQETVQSTQGTNTPSPETRTARASIPTPQTVTPAARTSSPTPSTVTPTARASSATPRNVTPAASTSTSTQGTSQSTPKAEPEIKIEMGRTAKITYKGQEYVIKKDIIKKDFEKEGKKIIEEMGIKFKTEHAKETIQTCLAEETIDRAILGVISRIKVPEEDKKKIMKQYILDAVNCRTMIKEKYEPKCDIKYNFNSLSKFNLIDMLRGKELDSEDKLEILRAGQTASRYGLAKTEGKYKVGIIERLIDRIKYIRMPETMPITEEVKLITSGKFNKIDDKEKKDFIDSIHAKDEAFYAKSKAMQISEEDISIDDEGR